MTKPSFKESLRFWFKLGCISFGGPAGQIAIMHDFLVTERKWISESRFMHALNYCMILPGPEAQQLATYIGWLLHGTIGGVVAGMLFILPSVFILLGLSIIYVTFGTLPWVMAMMAGLKPAIIAIIIVALFKIGKKSLISSFHYGIAIIAFIAIYFFHIPFPLIVLSTLIIGFLITKFLPKTLNKENKNDDKKAKDESNFYLNSNSNDVKSEVSYKKLFMFVAIGIIFWIIPLGIIYQFSTDFAFWKTLCLFFSKAAFVTFGGAYAVLPYVAQESVEKFHWLTSHQMMDGLALGETTPGPLIMVLAFVGFQGAYNHFGFSILLGTIGLLLTVFYTFLPSFIFIMVGAPIIEKTKENNQVKAVLGFVSAAVVGVLFNLVLYLAFSVLLPTKQFNSFDWAAAAWVIISFFALHKYKANLIVWLGISLIFGLVNYWLL